MLSFSTIVSCCVILIFVAYIYVVLAHQTMLSDMFKDIFFSTDRNNVIMQKESYRHLLLVISEGVIVVGSFGILFFYICSYFNTLFPIAEIEAQLGISFLLVGGYFLIRYLLFKILGGIFFNNSILLRKYIDTYVIILILTSVFIFPLVLAMIYSPIHYKGVISVLLSIGIIFQFVTLIFKTYQLFLQSYLSIIYVSMYIYAFEILPIAFIYTIVKF